MQMRAIFHFAVGPIGVALLGLIIVPLMAWVYPPEQLGQYAMMQLVINFTVLFFSLGLDHAYLREYHETENKVNLFVTVLRPGAILVLLTAALALVYSDLFSQWLYGDGSQWLALITVFAACSAFFSRFGSLILRMEGEGLLFSLSQLLPKALFLSLLLAVWFSAFEADVTTLLGIQALALVSVLFLFIILRPVNFLALFRLHFDLTNFKSLLSFALPLMLSGLIYWGLVSADRVMLRQMAGFSELGIYSVAFTIASAAMIFQSVFSTVWAPAVYKTAVEGSTNEQAGGEKSDAVEAMINKASSYISATVFGVFSLAGIFSWCLNYFLPEQYHDVPGVFICCFAYPLFYVLSEVTVVGVNLAKKSIYLLVASLLACVVNLLGNYWLIPLFGAAGAAAATAVAFFIFVVARTEFSKVVGVSVNTHKLYGNGALCLFLSVFTTLGADLLGIWGHFLWLVMFVVALVSYKSVYAEAIEWLRKRLGGMPSVNG